jgi:hypothetical protein
MNKHIALIAMTFFSALAACRPSGSGSQLNYKLLGTKALTKYKGQSAVTICLNSQQHADDVKRVVSMWYLALDSNPTVNIVDSGNCAAQVSYLNRGNGDSRTTISEDPHVMINADSEWFSSFGVLVHEFGHAFGLNDTYAGGNGQCQAGQPADAIMCTPSIGEPRQDDVDGVRDVAGLGKGTMPNYDSMVLGGGTVSNIGMGQKNPGYNPMQGQPSFQDMMAKLMYMNQAGKPMNQFHCSQALNATVVQKTGSADKNIAIVKAFPASGMTVCIGDTATCGSPHSFRFMTQKIEDNNQEWFVSSAITNQYQEALRAKTYQVDKTVPSIVTIEGMMGDPTLGMTARQPFRCEAYVSL